MSEVHDYKYQQLHEQLGYIQEDAVLNHLSTWRKQLSACYIWCLFFQTFFCWSLCERLCQCWACGSECHVSTTLVCFWKLPSWYFHSSADIHLSSSTCEDVSC